MDEASSSYKVINDCIHGTVTLPPAAVLVVDTPQFQRLRKIKQTGACCHVFPNATHNRFQHSIGVAHYARNFAEKLKSKDARLNVDAKDVVCVMLAGLCHDLGHGPNSHLWEHFMKEATKGRYYHHEDTSIAMLDALLDDNNLRPALKTVADIDDGDIVFIKEMIVGPLTEDAKRPDRGKSAIADPWPYKGRGVEKSFLYEIVANKLSGIDVDKWDYFLRDDYYLKIGHIFDPERFMSFCRVFKTKVNGVQRRRICLREKEAENLRNMYEDRKRLHTHGYQHRITKIVDAMLVEAYLKADKHVSVVGRGGRRFWLSEASLEDMEAHAKLVDEYVEYKILETDSRDIPELAEAQEILRRINHRDFWKDVGKVDSTFSNEDIIKGISAFYNGDASDFVVVRKRISLGVDAETSYFVFFDKNLEVSAVPASSLFRDGEFENETAFAVIKRTEAESVQCAKEAVRKWMETLTKRTN